MVNKMIVYHPTHGSMSHDIYITNSRELDLSLPEREPTSFIDLGELVDDQTPTKEGETQ